jgi:beta-lactamase class C
MTTAPRLLPLIPALLLILAAAGSHAAPATSSMSAYAEFDQAFGRILEEAFIPGGAYAIVSRDRIVQAAGHGVRVSGKPDPVTVDTVFRVASVSKTFAAQLTAMLVSEGQLRWEDGLTHFMPEFRLKQPGHAEQLQLHHLLSQSTGIVPNAYDNLLNASQPLDRIVPRFSELEPMCQPGRCYTYQNVLFSLVGPALEQVSGRSYGELLQERVFQPLAMDQASTGLAAFLDTRDRAWPHVRRGPTWWATEANENYYRVLPAAGVNASALDLGQWLIAQMGHRPEVIDPRLVAQTTEKRIRTSRELRRRGWRDLLTDAHYGLGWRIYTAGDEDIVLHSGWVRGFVAEVAYSPQRQIGLVVLLNAESSALNQITTTFWSQVLSEPMLAARKETEPLPSGQATSLTAP